MATKPKKPHGRPVTYTPEMAKAICEELAKGKTLRSICRSLDFPPEATVRRWALEDREGFSAQYTRARELGFLAMGDEILDIAADSSKDVSVSDAGVQSVNHGAIARARLRVDTLKWYLAKMLPKVYGDRTTLQHADADGNKIEQNMSDLDKLNQLAHVFAVAEYKQSTRH